VAHRTLRIVRELFDQVEAVAGTKLYYVALIAALAVPDIARRWSPTTG
jgi:hypothetical protein